MLDFWLPILVKAIATGLLVVVASVLAEVVGPFWGALVACLPVSAGPAYLFLALRHDADFVAASALNSAAANAATGLFLTAYALAARRLGLWASLAVSLGLWLVVAVAIHAIAWTPLTATLLNLVVYGLGFLALRGTQVAGPRQGSVVLRRWYDLPLKATAVGIFVSTVVLASSAMGPRATGIAAVFPISLTSLIVILRPRIGGPASAFLAATALRAMLGFGLALLALHLAVRPWGVWTALLTGLLVSMVWPAVLLVIRRR
jgi:hypothetical protein